MGNEMFKGFIDLIILMVLKENDSYGYLIAKTIKNQSKELYSIEEGTLYPALQRLAKKSLIESYWCEANGSPKRKYYKITKDGINSISEKLNEFNNIKKLIACFEEDNHE